MHNGHDVVDWEEVSSCDLCGSDSFKRVLAAPDLTERTIGGLHALVRCVHCNLHFLNPRPTKLDIGKVYPADYVPYVDSSSRSIRRWQYCVAAKDPGRLSWLDRLSVHLGRYYTHQTHIPGWQGEGKILDVGCGNGSLLDTLKQAGWETHGVDLSPRAVAVANGKGHRIHCGNVEDLGYPDKSVDAVNLSQVLEHTFSPRRALLEIRRVLRPSGSLYLAVPNWGGLQACFLRRFWSGLDLPRHLYQFDAKTLRRYLDESDFRIIEIITRTGGMSWAKNIRLLFNGIFSLSWRREPGWLVAFFEPHALLSGLFRRFMWGRDLRVICQKK